MRPYVCVFGCVCVSVYRPYECVCVLTKKNSVNKCGNMSFCVCDGTNNLPTLYTHYDSMGTISTVFFLSLFFDRCSLYFGASSVSFFSSLLSVLFLFWGCFFFLFRVSQEPCSICIDFANCLLKSEKCLQLIYFIFFSSTFF